MSRPLNQFVSLTFTTLRAIRVPAVVAIAVGSVYFGAWTKSTEPDPDLDSMPGTAPVVQQWGGDAADSPVVQRSTRATRATADVRG